MTDDGATAATKVGAGGGPLRLVVLAAGLAKAVDLPRDGVVTLGRSRECDVVLDDASVSRRHAVVRVASGAVTLEDLGSANGTRVRGERLAPRAPVAVGPGDIFEVGDVRATVAAAPRREAGASAMDRARALAASVAKGTISVLIVGETGAGKEVLARDIHAQSARATMPLVAVNCAALPESLLESELFGYEKGAFTGATASKPGLFDAASGGTLLLDEIGDMPLSTQAKVLRVLETREVTPLGSVRSKAVDVRFVSATNRSLDALVREGTFREDLLFRIAGVVLEVPPLRDRPAEIAPLAARLLAEECARAGVAPKSLGADAIALLESWTWPGNVRELRSAMERAALLARGDLVDASELLLGQRGAGSIAPAPAPPDTAEGGERARIEAALERCGGNQKEAAALLGITRRALMYRMDRHGLKRPRKRR